MIRTVDVNVNYRVKRDKNNNPQIQSSDLVKYIRVDGFCHSREKTSMNENYRTFFGLSKEPFGADIAIKDILKTNQLVDVKNRFDYVLRLGAVGLVTRRGRQRKIDGHPLRARQPASIRVLQHLRYRLLRFYHGALPAIVK